MMERWYEMSPPDILEGLDVDAAEGLSPGQVEENRREFGANEFEKKAADSLAVKILKHMKDISTLILLLAAVLSLLLALREGHGFLEPVVILAIIAMNLVLAITQEGKAEKALEALSDLNSPT
ncbi:MAG: cation-transporting P-type ATPase [Oscillospiraceae bacterium]